MRYGFNFQTGLLASMREGEVFIGAFGGMLGSAVGKLPLLGFYERGVAVFRRVC
jgi:hypothetical protein